MNIGIIAANNIRYSPYIFFYTEILKENNIKYELIYPDRCKVKDTFDAPVIVLPWNKNKSTLHNYLNYSSAVKKVLKQKKYDYVIALTTLNAVFLGLWLKKHYYRKYIVDIRDYSHENIYPFFLLEKIAVQNSLINIISSKKFTTFLPYADYFVCHNIVQEEQNVKFESSSGNRIKIGYVGSFSYIDQCEKIMYLVARDSRFSLEFYGTGQCESILRDIALKLQCDHISFHGAYLPNEKGKILQEIDILFNAYGNGCPLLDYALSNKLYDALLYKKPIITSPNTFMDEMAGPLSFSTDLADNGTLDRLYSWYKNIDGEQIEKYSTKMIVSIIRENDETKQRILKSLLSDTLQ